jgi:hypothetical protein
MDANPSGEGTLRAVETDSGAPTRPNEGPKEWATTARRDPDETPESLWESIRTHAEWTDAQRDDQLDRLIVEFPIDRVQAAVRPWLRDLGGADGEILLRLIEAHPTREFLQELAGAMIAQPELAPERAWDALALIDGAGLLDSFPELAERWEELSDTLDEDGSLEQLIEQLEEDPEGTWLALHALGAVEPDVRAAIVAGLAQAAAPPRVPGPGLIEFFRLLSFAHDPATRTAALAALSSLRRDDPLVRAAWASIAADHVDPAVAATARGWWGVETEAATVLARRVGAGSEAPRVVRSLVTALDGGGRGWIVLSARRAGARATVAFVCDVCRGIDDVMGQSVPDSPRADAFFEEMAGQADRDHLEDVPELALGLLAGTLLECGPATSPALRFWLEATIGPGVRPRAMPAPFAGWDPASLPLNEMAGRTETVLACCPTWRDGSALTFQLAEEIALREGQSPPDPRRDAGAYRYLFEHRLQGRLELFRRMLLWMASFWEASSDVELGRSALALAWQLSDEQHAVPAHPFTVALTTHSLAAAQASLRRGIDPRRTPR